MSRYSEEGRSKLSERTKRYWTRADYREKMVEVSRDTALRRWETSDIQPKKKVFYERFCEFLLGEGYEILSSLDDYCKIGATMKVRCPNGHLLGFSWKEWKSGRRCRLCEFEDTLKRLDELITRKCYDLIDIEVTNNKWLRVSKVHIVCPNGHTSVVDVGNFLNGHECRFCVTKVSEIEYEIRNFLDIHSIRYEQSNRSLIAPYELDFVISENKVAIEFDGYPYHTEKIGNTDKDYHLKKTEMCEKIGYKLVHIFYDEWEEPLRCITQKRLLHILNQSQETRIYARRCEAKEISVEQYKEFCIKTHLQGYAQASVKLGLFHNNELIGIMSFGRLNRAKGSKNKEHHWELIRYSTNSVVIGGASKLFSYFKKNYQWESILSYADRRWSEGHLYETLGFSFDGFTQCGYWYMRNGSERLHRFGFRKSMLIGDKSKTEWELMQDMKYDRIWDCGHYRFILLNTQDR